MQFAWRPTQGSDTKEGLLLSSDGKVYLATIGGILQEQTKSFKEAAAAAAWSPDGSCIALGSDAAILRVEHFESKEGFTVEVASEVCVISTFQRQFLWQNLNDCTHIYNH